MMKLLMSLKKLLLVFIKFVIKGTGKAALRKKKRDKVLYIFKFFAKISCENVYNFINFPLN